jgi:hypothetical protein
MTAMDASENWIFEPDLRSLQERAFPRFRARDRLQAGSYIDRLTTLLPAGEIFLHVHF